MATSCELEWPEVVAVPESIGAGRYCNDSGFPCCAIGYFRVAVGGRADEPAGNHDLWGYWMDAWRKCACVILGRPAMHMGPAYINDELLQPRQRVLNWAATWLYLGVAIDREVPGAAELAEKAKGI